jgi:hypothetical protein
VNFFSRVINFVIISILIYRRQANVCANPVGGVRSACYLNGDKIIRHKGLCNGLGGSPASHRGDLGSKPVQSMWDLWCIKWYWKRLFNEFSAVCYNERGGILSADVARACA